MDTDKDIDTLNQLYCPQLLTGKLRNNNNNNS